MACGTTAGSGTAAPRAACRRGLPLARLQRQALGCALRRCEARRSPMGAVRADSRRRRWSPHGTAIRRSCRYGDGTHSVCWPIMSAIRPLAVAATDNGRRAPELAAGIARVEKAPVDRRAHGKLAHPPADAGASERADCGVCARAARQLHRSHHGFAARVAVCASREETAQQHPGGVAPFELSTVSARPS